jgi:16S rRNA (cytosine1402-N4)-methyltransferase
MNEVLRALAPKDGEVYVDGTFGAGGYSRTILDAASCHVIGLDRDPSVAHHVDALKQQFGDRFSFKQCAFSDMQSAVDGEKIDGVVLDIGVSSMQLDEGERGFSFMREGPLDMRMSSQGPSAADAVNFLDIRALTVIFQTYGEERRAKRCAQFIVRARDMAKITTTEELAGILTQALGQGGKKHPATRVFQALRIYINDELGELSRALRAAEHILTPGGRLVVVSFHSLEDRIVKSFLRARSGEKSGGSRYMPPVEESKDMPSFTLPFRSTMSATKDELANNTRSRSAKLRAAIRTEAPVWPHHNEDAERGLVGVPSLDELAEMAA